MTDDKNTQISSKTDTEKVVEGKPVEPTPTPSGDVLAGLDPTSVAILQELRRNPGSTMVKIAERLNLDRRTVSERIRTARFQRAYHEITLKATQLLDRYAPDAARKLGQLIQSRDEKIASTASNRILVHHLGLNVNVGPQEPKPPAGVVEQDSKELIRRWIKGMAQRQAIDVAAD